MQDTVEILQARIDAHERICAERYKNIEDALDSIKVSQSRMYEHVNTYIKWLLWTLMALALGSVFGHDRIAQAVLKLLPGS